MEEERVFELEARVRRLEEAQRQASDVQKELKEDLRALEATIVDMRAEMAKLSQLLEHVASSLLTSQGVIERVAALETRLSMLQWFIPILIAVIELLARLWT